MGRIEESVNRELQGKRSVGESRDFKVDNMRRADGAVAELKFYTASIEQKIEALKDNEDWDADKVDIGYELEMLSMMVGRLQAVAT